MKSESAISNTYLRSNEPYSPLFITQYERSTYGANSQFSVDHNVLEPGIYVSRSDADEATGCITTTFDLRMTAPNREPVMDTAAVHALEHLGATFLRNDTEWKDRVIYFGPMGCRTGFT